MVLLLTSTAHSAACARPGGAGKGGRNLTAKLTDDTHNCIQAVFVGAAAYVVGKRHRSRFERSTHATMVNLLRCLLDELRRYRSFPCSQCTSPRCPFGKKPVVLVPLSVGQKRCVNCEQAFTPGGGQDRKRLYCTDECRRVKRLKRRRARRLGRGDVYSGAA
ncbi:MAG: hypothetical protein WKH64_07655 [Chloroflexia bacterium]